MPFWINQLVFNKLNIKNWGICLIQQLLCINRMCLKNQYSSQKTHNEYYNIWKGLNKFSKQIILYENYKILSQKMISHFC